jgi:broad specificity phosphatase PhoE
LIYAGDFEIREELIEVLNAGVFLKMTNLPSILRSIIGRIAWYFNYSGMPETREQSSARAQKFLSELMALPEKNTLIITHGFFMHTLKHQLRKHGFRGRLSMIPKNGHPYVFER